MVFAGARVCIPVCEPESFFAPAIHSVFFCSVLLATMANLVQSTAMSHNEVRTEAVIEMLPAWWPRSADDSPFRHVYRLPISDAGVDLEVPEVPEAMSHRLMPAVGTQAPFTTSQLSHTRRNKKGANRRPAADGAGNRPPQRSTKLRR